MLVLFSFFSLVFLFAQENYKARLLVISQELVKYVARSKNEVNICKDIVTKADSLLRNDKIKLKFTNEKNIIGGIRFVFDKQDENKRLEVSERFLKTYNGKYTFHYSILVREYANIYHFHTYKYFQDKNDAPTQFLYKAKAMKIQAEIIETFLQPTGLKLSTYEESLVKSKYQDGFEVGMRFLERVSIYYTQFLQDLFAKIQNGKYPKIKTLKQLNEFLLSVISQYNKKSKLSKQFYVYTSIETFDALIDFYSKKLTKAESEIFAVFSQRAKTILYSAKKEISDYYENTILKFYETKIDKMLSLKI